MQPTTSCGPPVRMFRSIVAALCMFLLFPGDVALLAIQSDQSKAPADQEAAKLPPEQLDSLVAPIALYPDPMLTQVLVASTYPLEIIQLQQWLTKHKDLKDKALTDAVKKEDWDPSVQAMAALPDVVKQMAENVKWTTDLGNAFLAQQSDVMDACQRMRKKAQDAGNLKSTKEQKVETQVVENKQVIVIQQASPEVVYVPSYNPVVVYGPPVYPYPPIAYPPPGYYAAGMAISFGIGVAMGAAWGGGWGWGAGWGHNDVDINVNNNFNRNTNISNSGNRVNGGNRVSNQPAGGNKWQHNPQHRGGAPYSDRATANKYGGTARGDSMATRQANARQNQGQRGNRPQAGTADRGAGGRQQTGGGDRSAGNRDAGNRASAGTSDRGAGSRDGGSRPSAGTSDRAGAGDRSAGSRDTGNRGGGGGGDRVGNRSVPSGGGGSSAFGGGSGERSGSSARSSSSRGRSSMGGSGSRGGGGRRR